MNDLVALDLVEYGTAIIFLLPCDAMDKRGICHLAVAGCLSRSCTVNILKLFHRTRCLIAIFNQHLTLSWKRYKTGP